MWHSERTTRFQLHSLQSLRQGRLVSIHNYTQECISITPFCVCVCLNSCSHSTCSPTATGAFSFSTSREVDICFELQFRHFSSVLRYVFLPIRLRFSAYSHHQSSDVFQSVLIRVRYHPAFGTPKCLAFQMLFPKCIPVFDVPLKVYHPST